MPAQAALEAAGIPVASYPVPPGEASKSLETAAAIYDWLIGQRAERGQAIVALGGGMVTDLAGYVAAPPPRGLAPGRRAPPPPAGACPRGPAPPGLRARVAAAIGGKVGVNHPRAKNVIGAFYQPRLVLADVSTLRTLPPRGLGPGRAGILKH